MREIHDHFFLKAKAEGYLSRAAYKLIEIDDRKRVLRPGMLVLDAGCAPGSWIQVLVQRVGPRGGVIGVDLKEVDERLFPENVRIVQGDLAEMSRDDLLGRFRDRVPSGDGPFLDAIVSDMAPDTTGDPFGDSHRSVRLCQMLLDRARAWLKPKGNLVMKVFEGEAYPALLARAARAFESARGFKPKASRGESVEIYLVAKGYLGARHDPAQGEAQERPKPSKGWGTNR
jgi:23S rRNA (uridine2552-2'-O)-methyltransferase